MPDWQPGSVPDFCPICGVYWECGHKLMGRAQAFERGREGTGEMSEFEEAVEAASAKGKQILRDALEASIRESENQGWNERNPWTHIIWDKPDSLGLAKADGGDLTFGTSEEARRKPLPDVEYLSRQREEPPFDPNVQPVLRYIDEDEDDG